MGQTLGLVQVDQSTVAIKETFGKYNEVLEPGCHFLPWCIGQRVAGYLSLRVRQLDVRCETKTKVFFNTPYLGLFFVGAFYDQTNLWNCIITKYISESCCSWIPLLIQDNVFVTVVASVQYRALADKASDAFYKLSNTREQIQSYVFDGKCSVMLCIHFVQVQSFIVSIICDFRVVSLPWIHPCFLCPEVLVYTLLVCYMTI